LKWVSASNVTRKETPKWTAGLPVINRKEKNWLTKQTVRTARQKVFS
jgi:hypothetical protein